MALKLPVEYIHLILTADDAPSALGMWLGLFDGEEPTYLATDEDGDTNARGPKDGFWVDLHRIDDDLHLYATPVERKSAYDRAGRFENGRWSSVMEDLISIAEKAASSLEIQRITVHIVSSLQCENQSQAIEAYRALGPNFASTPSRAVDGRYQFSVVDRSERLNRYGYRRSILYRFGSRAVADPEGDYEGENGVPVKLCPHVGQEVTVVSRRPDEKALPKADITVFLHELAEEAAKVWGAGLDAFA